MSFRPRRGRSGGAIQIRGGWIAIDVVDSDARSSVNGVHDGVASLKFVVRHTPPFTVPRKTIFASLTGVAILAAFAWAMSGLIL